MKKHIDCHGKEHQLRWGNLLIIRALLFAITIALSSSGEDVEPLFDTAESHLAAPHRLLVERGTVRGVHHNTERELQYSKSSSKSKSAKAKSTKIWSKIRGIKSKGAKVGSESKSGKSKSGKSKSAKSKSAKGSSKSKSSKISSSKSGSSGDSSSKVGKSEEGKSARSHHSSAESKDSTDMEPVTKKQKGDVEDVPLKQEDDEQSVDASSMSGVESASVNHDDGDVKREPDDAQIESNMISSIDEAAEENDRSGGAPSSSEANEQDDIENVTKTQVVQEGNDPDNIDMEVDNIDKDKSGIEEAFDTISVDINPSQSNDSSHSAEGGNGEDSVDDTNIAAESVHLETKFNEERIEESEDMKDLGQDEEVFDNSNEAIE